MQTPSQKRNEKHGGCTWLQRAPAHVPWLHTEVAHRLWSRAECIQTPVHSWMQLGVLNDEAEVGSWVDAKHGGAQAVPLAWPYGGHAKATTHRVAMHTQDTEIVLSPALKAGVDMLWSNLQLHWAEQPLAWMKQWQSHLNSDGYVMFSCYGPDTLRGLRQVYADKGWSVPAQQFVDMHDIGDMLVQAGFSNPVVDMEKLRLHFSSAAALRAELRDLGRNTALQRNAITRGKQWLQSWDKVVEAALKESDGRLYVEIEVIYGHAFYIPKKTVEQEAVAGETRIGLDALRKKLKERGLP